MIKFNSSNLFNPFDDPIRLGHDNSLIKSFYFLFSFSKIKNMCITFKDNHKILLIT